MPSYIFIFYYQLVSGLFRADYLAAHLGLKPTLNLRLIFSPTLVLCRVLLIKAVAVVAVVVWTGGGWTGEVWAGEVWAADNDFF